MSTLYFSLENYPKGGPLDDFSLDFARFCQTPVLGLGLGVDFTFTLDNNNNNDNNNYNDNNPHLNLLKETVPGGKEQGLGIRDKISGIKHKG